MPDGKKQQQKWQISVHGKAKSFDFKLRATKICPPWFSASPRLSFLFRLRSLTLHFKSESHSPSSFKSKLRRALSKFRPPRCNLKRTHSSSALRTLFVQHPEQDFTNPVLQLGELVPQVLVSVSSWIIGGVVLVAQLVTQIKKISTNLCNFAMLLSFQRLLFKNIIRSKLGSFMLVSVAASMACSIVFDLKKPSWLCL